MIHLDTHTALWLWAGRLDRIPDVLQARLEDDDLAMSPMVRLEVAYLHDVGRISETSTDVFEGLRRAAGVGEDPTSFAEVAAVAATMTWTRDVFDRTIAAKAVAAGALLATKDRRIRAALPEHTTWD